MDLSEFFKVQREQEQLVSRYNALRDEAAKTGWSFAMTVKAANLSADCDKLQKRVNAIKEELGIK